MSAEKKAKTILYLEAAGKVLERLREMGFDTEDQPGDAEAVLRLALGGLYPRFNVDVTLETGFK